MNSILPYLARLPSVIERSDYVFRFARELGIENKRLLEELRRAAKEKRSKLADEPVASAVSMKFSEKRLLQLLIGNAELQQEVLPLCSRQDFEGLVAERIFSKLLDMFEKNQTGTYEAFHRHFAGEAEQALLEARSRAPYSHRLLYNLGTVYYEQHRLRDAREVFDLAVRSEPGYPQARMGLAAALFALGETDLAVDQLERTIQIAPGTEIAAQAASLKVQWRNKR